MPALWAFVTGRLAAGLASRPQTCPPPFTSARPANTVVRFFGRHGSKRLRAIAVLHAVQPIPSYGFRPGVIRPGGDRSPRAHLGVGLRARRTPHRPWPIRLHPSCSF